MRSEKPSLTALRRALLPRTLERLEAIANHAPRKAQAVWMEIYTYQLPIEMETRDWRQLLSQVDRTQEWGLTYTTVQESCGIKQ